MTNLSASFYFAIIGLAACLLGQLVTPSDAEQVYSIYNYEPTKTQRMTEGQLVGARLHPDRLPYRSGDDTLFARTRGSRHLVTREALGHNHTRMTVLEL